MPLQIPKIDDRRYQDLLDEALLRIPVHNPEWTNFNRSDPGVTLVELFAFMTESLLYRANLIPERNRLKFLQLLGIPLNPATSARGIVALTNERGLPETITLNAGLELAAGQVPFRTARGLDVLPVEGRVYYKRPADADEEVKNSYRQLYASFEGAPLESNVELELYETALLAGADEKGVSLAEETIDGALWIALLARENAGVEAMRKQIANRTLSLGIVPALDRAALDLAPGGQQANAESETWLVYEIPKQPNADWTLPPLAAERVPAYRPLEASATADPATAPAVVELALPGEDELRLWSNLDPLEAGAGEFPPTLDDTRLADRLITWVRLRATSQASKFRFLWVGVNAAMVSQRTRVAGEILADGTGEPDQRVKLARAPVVDGSVRLFVTVGEVTEEWRPIDDLWAAGAEIAAADLRRMPGTPPPPAQNAKVFAVDAEAGEIRFGDGLHGQRPPSRARLVASYDYGAGLAGNVGAGAINAGALLPAGIKVANPLRTWGGADAETVVDGEKQIARFLQHRERLVTVEDFETIVWRTPGVALGRVEIIPAFNPDFAPNEPGDAPGALTIMVIPRFDPAQPDAPLPDRLFLDAICRFVDERRLITTEIYLRPPVYKPLWISVGLDVTAEKSVPEVREAVKRALLDFLAPINPAFAADPQAALPFGAAVGGAAAAVNKGWRLRKPVSDKELLAVASRVAGVMFVNRLLLAEGTRAADEVVKMNGLELPRVMGVAVSIGDALPLDQLRGTAAATSDGDGTAGGGDAGGRRRVVPIPIVPEEC